jgi:hypothetical protein
MSLAGLLLGLINILIVVVILVLIGAIIMWVLSALGFAVPQLVQRLYLAVVALIALYMLIALLLGIPSMRIVGHAGLPFFRAAA